MSIMLSRRLPSVENLGSVLGIYLIPPIGGGIPAAGIGGRPAGGTARGTAAILRAAAFLFLAGTFLAAVFLRGGIYFFPFADVLPIAGNFRFTAARTWAFSAELPCWATRDRALRAWAASGIG
jgi:hypothetical protein